jgi:hypothetical protein
MQDRQVGHGCDQPIEFSYSSGSAEAVILRHQPLAIYVCDIEESHRLRTAAARPQRVVLVKAELQMVRVKAGSAPACWHAREARETELMEPWGPDDLTSGQSASIGLVPPSGYKQAI